MFFNRLFSYLTLICLIAGCGSKTMQAQNNSSDKPFWIENPDQKYPMSAFITALGVNQSKTAAENDALRGISQVFQSSVTSSVNLNDLKIETNESLNSTVSLIKDVTISSNNQLINTSVTDYYYDSGEDKHYVLAVMDKAKTRPLYKAQFDANNDQITKWLQTADSESDGFRKMGNYRNVADLLTANKALVEMLRVLGQLSLAHDEVITEQELNKKSNSVLEQLHVHIASSAGFPAKLRDGLQRELVNFGFKINPNVTKSALILTCDFQAEPLELPGNDAKFVSWTFSVKINRTSDSANVSVFEKSGRSGQLTIKAAEQRAQFNLEKIIKNEFSDFIKSELFQ